MDSSRGWLLLLVSFLHALSVPMVAVLGTGDAASLGFLNRARELDFLEWMVGIRRMIHEKPELGYEEFETSKLIQSELLRMDIPYNHSVAVTGIIASIGTGKPPFVALRADMDALAIQEKVEWEHKSKVPGKMHACGHDAHTAMLLGAAKILQEHKNELKGTVVLIFQPAEEGGGGAKKMIEAGAVDNVNVVFGFHVSPADLLGTVASRPGPLMAGSGFFEAVIIGKGGHAAIPQHTIDPIVAASNVIVSLQHLVSREADPLEPQVVTVAKFQGGEAYNVIPDSVTIGGTFRAFSKASFSHLKKRIEEVIIAQASVHRCSAMVNFFENEKPFFPVTYNNDILHAFFQKVAGEVIGGGNVRNSNQVMASEDFAFYTEIRPSLYYLLGMQSESGKLLSPPHSPYFTINEDMLPYGAALHASLALQYLLEADSVQSFLGAPSSHDEL